MVAFDLDPGPPAGLAECLEVALLLRDLLGQLSLDCYAKTSGSKGMQVYMPLNSDVGYDDTKPFAHGLAKLLQAQPPRPGGVRDDARASAPERSSSTGARTPATRPPSGPYSLRARERPTVSCPLTWDEVESGEVDTLSLDAPAVLERLADAGDPFAPVLEREQELPAL